MTTNENHVYRKPAAWSVFAYPGRRRCGTAAIELALSLPVLVGLFLGTLRFGYSFYIYNELEQAVRAGARYASLRTYASRTETPDPAYADAVRNVVVYGNPAGGTQAVAPGLTGACVFITMQMRNSAPSAVTVYINHAGQDPKHPVCFLPQVIGSVLLTNKPATQFPFLGVFAPPAS
jgi:Flp pilus assembly protein TadG